VNLAERRCLTASGSLTVIRIVIFAANNVDTLVSSGVFCTQKGTMMNGKLMIRVLSLMCLALVALALAPGPNVAEAYHDYSCLPSCAEADGRFLSLAGANLQTLAGDQISLELIAPSATTELELGIFDGETGGLWDTGAVSLV
jgi:hypothetical protein